MNRLETSGGNGNQKRNFDNTINIRLHEIIQLKNISAVYIEGAVKIEWMAQSTGQDFVFIVERSDDGKMFEIIGITRNEENNGDEQFVYNYTDKKPQSKFPYYRIIYVEKSKVIFGQIKVIENIEHLMMKENNTIKFRQAV